ncbi:MAG: DUF3008 family protein [bacterium]
MKKHKPTFKDPVSTQSKNFEKDFDKTMTMKGIDLAEDELLTEKEQSLKKKIFSLPKMESLVFSDPKLSAVYNEMAEDGEEKYGYHYNETIMNIIFNEYVLNSSKYLQKYKNAIPKKKKRRDKSGIEQMKKTYGNKGDKKDDKRDDKKSKDVDETTSAGGGPGGAGGSVGSYETPYAWANKGSEMMKKPIWKGGSIVAESNYLTNPKGFKILSETFDNDLKAAEEQAQKSSKEEGVAVHVNSIGNNKYDITDWYDEDSTVSSFENGRKINETMEFNEKAKSKNQQKFMGMVYAYKKGELDDSDVSDEVKDAAKSISLEDAKDFAATKHDDIEEASSMLHPDDMTMANKGEPVDNQSSNMDTGIQSSSGMNEDSIDKIFEDLETFTKYHDKLQKITEETLPSAIVLKNRLGDKNKKNFKKDMKDNSATKGVMKMEKDIQWKDQQTDVGDNPHKYTEDIEKNSLKANDGEAFDNEGNSTNYDGDQIPKRNLTDDEQEEVNMYRKGMEDWEYDLEPDKRFKERMKNDMGDKIYKRGEDKKEFRKNAPTYNKDAQPVQDEEKYDKKINETMITGRYHDLLGKSNIIDFKIGEVKSINENVDVSDLFKLDFTGLGNKYKGRTIENKVVVNENVDKYITINEFYTDGKKVFRLKSKKKTINESDNKTKGNKLINEEHNKMKHLLGYKPSDFTSTSNIKKNRGF